MIVMLKNSSGTDTSLGYINHLSFRGIRCPVKLMTCILSTGGAELKIHDGFPVPMLDKYGNYLYALPAGGEITKATAVLLEGRNHYDH